MHLGTIKEHHQNIIDSLEDDAEVFVGTTTSTCNSFAQTMEMWRSTVCAKSREMKQLEEVLNEKALVLEAKRKSKMDRIFGDWDGYNVSPGTGPTMGQFSTLNDPTSPRARRRARRRNDRKIVNRCRAYYAKPQRFYLEAALGITGTAPPGSAWGGPLSRAIAAAFRDLTPARCGALLLIVRRVGFFSTQMFREVLGQVIEICYSTAPILPAQDRLWANSQTCTSPAIRGPETRPASAWPISACRLKKGWSMIGL